MGACSSSSLDSLVLWPGLQYIQAANKPVGGNCICVFWRRQKGISFKEVPFAILGLFFKLQSQMTSYIKKSQATDSQETCSYGKKETNNTYSVEFKLRPRVVRSLKLKKAKHEY